MYYSFICKCCNQAIVGGEECVLINVKDGKAVKQTIGTYNKMGGIDEEYSLNDNSRFKADKNNCVAYHKFCYDKASNETKNDLTISLLDPNNGYGETQIKFMPFEAKLFAVRDDIIELCKTTTPAKRAQLLNNIDAKTRIDGTQPRPIKKTKSKTKNADEKTTNTTTAKTSKK